MATHRLQQKELRVKQLVSYDLVLPGQSYERLWIELGRLGGVRALKSQWVVNWSGSSEALRDHLRRFIDSNDRLLVVSLDSSDWASYNAMVNLNAA